MNTEITSTESFDSLLRNNPQLNSPATLQGIAALVEKLAPILQGERLHNVIDLLSAVSDVVDMTDDAMVQKMMQSYESLTTSAFNLNNAVRYAAAQAGDEKEPPTAWQLLRRLNRDEDTRRGMAMVLGILGLLGKQARQGAEELPED